MDIALIAYWILCITPITHGVFNLTILHTNDCHARFAETSIYGSPCGDTSSGKCFGGVARRYTKVNEIRQRVENVVLLDAGDQFQGTLWFYVYKGMAASHFMNKLRYDAMAVGNHEFDIGPAGLAGFLENVTFPVLSSNIDTSKEPALDGLIQKSVILSVGPNREKVGIVGYTTSETPQLSSTGKVIFEAEASAIQREVDKLTAQGVNKIIAVGHAGYGVDLQLANTLRGVGVIVGGHTNTFLYTGVSPSNEKPVATYPTMVTNQDGNNVLVVQDYAFGKYLGNLQVTFSDAGKVTSWSGNPILLDKSTIQDTGILNDIQKWESPVSDIMNKTTGRTHVFLDGQRDHCRLQECNLGNMLADALILRNIKHPDETAWANVSIAVLNSGSIRSSMPQGTITVGDVLTVWPFQNTVDIVELKGQHLRLMLERSVTEYDVIDQHGRFLQISGLLVKYDLSKPDGQRVVSVEARCARCPVPEYEPLVDDQVYQILVSSFLINGGDGYDVFQKYAVKHHVIGDLDSDIAVEYITQYSPIFAGLERRIQFVNQSADPCSTVTPTYTSESTNDTTTENDSTTRIAMTCQPPVKIDPCITGSTTTLSASFEIIVACICSLYILFDRKH